MLSKRLRQPVVNGAGGGVEIDPDGRQRLARCRTRPGPVFVGVAVGPELGKRVRSGFVELELEQKHVPRCSDHHIGPALRGVYRPAARLTVDEHAEVAENDMDQPVVEALGLLLVSVGGQISQNRFENMADAVKVAVQKSRIHVEHRAARISAVTADASDRWD